MIIFVQRSPRWNSERDIAGNLRRERNRIENVDIRNVAKDTVNARGDGYNKGSSEICFERMIKEFKRKSKWS